MRSLLTAVTVAVMLVAGCATASPSHAPAAPSASGSLTPRESAVVPSHAIDPTPPTPTIAPIDAPYPEAAFSVVATYDATGAIEVATTLGRAKAGALVDYAYACEQPTKIKAVVHDGGDSTENLGGFEVACEPGAIAGISTPSISSTAYLSLEVTADPPVRFWVKLAVPTDHLLP